MNQDKIVGMHSISAALNKDHIDILQVYVQEGRRDKRMTALMDQLNKKSVSIEELSKKDLDSLSGGLSHQGVIADVRIHQKHSEKNLLDLIEKTDSPLVLILDGVTDPHNLGAILRTADAAGVTCVIAPKDNAVGVNSTVRKIASGAAETVPFIQVTNLVRTMKQLQDAGIWIYGAAGEASENIYQTKLDGAIAIAMGAEGDGLRRLTREHCDFLIHIPMTGSVSSLNVSVATGIIAYEVYRQRHVKK
jgi:23S rRNA (guanosine2251-2'-O)-methyltransferase